jgi:carboxypeptidase A4
VGTDVNRNWNFKWDVPGGSSTNPCSETYRGLAPSDTPENKALANHILSVAQAVGVKFYVDWHSYSQMILLPYGYSCTVKVDDLDAQMALAAGVQSAIRGVNGLTFAYGPICNTIYQTSGGSTDWANDVAKVELAWSFELRPTGSSSGGFVIPASNIVPSGREMWAGIANLFGKF